MTRRRIERVSTYYRLGRTQPTLEFVDVDVYGDTRLFVDPTAIRTLGSEWSRECMALIQDFFETVLGALRDERKSRARQLLLGLSEPNETHLGVSRGRAKGHAIGWGFATAITESLAQSEAVRSGLLRDLEETALMIPGIDADIVSDITTNVIREPLIRYTQAICQRYGIPTQSGVSSGPLWNPSTGSWFNRFEDLPVTKYGKLLLVPKMIVRDQLIYRPDEYFHNYILEFLRNQELDAGSALVQLLRDGRQRVTKKDLIGKYGKGKEVALRVTLEHPEILDQYRHAKGGGVQPLDHLDLSSVTEAATPAWQELLAEVQGQSPGSENAAAYHRAVESFLSASLYPALANPRIEEAIHMGRKRIDILYDNVARAGFFWWMGQHYKAPQVVVECKNYSGDPGNPELDQIAGRFSSHRGEVGFLVVRAFEDKNLFVERCRDTALDGRGFVIPLDDKDLRELLNDRQDGSLEFPTLRARFQRLV